MAITYKESWDNFCPNALNVILVMLNSFAITFNQPSFIVFEILVKNVRRIIKVYKEQKMNPGSNSYKESWEDQSKCIKCSLFHAVHFCHYILSVIFYGFRGISQK